MAELADELDETLFTAVLNNDYHVLHYILPDHRNNTYCLRTKRHKLTLILGTFSKDFYLKTCRPITIFNLFFTIFNLVMCCVLPTT